MITKGETEYHITSWRDDLDRIVTEVCIWIGMVVGVLFIALMLTDLGLLR